MSSWKKNEWVIEGLLKKGQVALLSGNPKVGKSFIALRAAAAVSSGDNFFGRDTIEGKVLYLAAERAMSLEDRGNAVIEAGIPFNPDNIDVYPKPVAFLDEGELTKFIREVGSTDLIIIDTLRRCFAGGKENDNNDMTAWVYAIERFCEETGSAAIVIHHNQRRRHDTLGRVVDGDFAGGGALLGSVDCQLRVTKTADGVIQLREVESNNKTSFAADLKIENIILRSGVHVGLAIEEDRIVHRGDLAERVYGVLKKSDPLTLSDLHAECLKSPEILGGWGKISKESVRIILAKHEKEGKVISEPNPKHSQQKLYRQVEPTRGR